MILMILARKKAICFAMAGMIKRQGKKLKFKRAVSPIIYDMIHNLSQLSVKYVMI